MSRQRLEISICYRDKSGKKRYANALGSLWIDTDTMRGNIDLPPGVSISGGAHYVNVQPPFDKGGEQRGASRSRDDDDDIPY